MTNSAAKHKLANWRPVLLASVSALSLMVAPLAMAEGKGAGAQTKLTQAQAEALDEWTYSLALQVANWGLPLVTMYNLRHNDATGPHAKAKVNDIWRMEDISTPELAKQAGYVTPNVNVIYGFGFLDLGPEPVILSVPNSDNLYYVVEIVDMYTNAFAYVGGKATGYEGGQFALVGPGWKGTLPAGVTRIDAPTRWVLIQPRVHLYKDGKVVHDMARQVMDTITTTGLAKFEGKTPVKLPAYDFPAPVTTNPDLPVSALDFKDPLQFWELFSTAMNENPPPEDQIKALMPSFKPLGIELGKQWDRSSVSPEVVAAMSKAASKLPTILTELPFGSHYQGAFIPAPTIGNSQTDYRTRAIIARIGLTANTPEEAVYWIYTVDSAGQPLTGDKSYAMTFKEGLPYDKPGFWSLTMYDANNNYTVPNPINRYMLGSDTPELKKNADGSFTIYIQAESPGKDKEANWLPAPKGPFYLIPRSYAPAKATVNILTDPTSWPVPAVEESKR
ncbi:conserved exported hypothetical protein [uncultured Defluviicoccus sp.]|uniref:DUF1254 domain-containing protein n=1 Tax=metagenome TaxID=256318 RepID=A0A380TCF5_9ZZZZ|nr:conserved exported hypothetical protein [uncultured Defluviicoccus sp.]